MSVKQMKNKKWRCCVRYKDAFGIVHQKKKETFHTKKSAQEWERNFLAMYDGKALPGLTFRQLAEAFLKDSEPRWKKNTIENNRTLCKLAFRYIGDMLVDSITPQTIHAMQTQLLQDDSLAISTKKHVNAEVSKIFNFAVKFRGLAQNPCRSSRFECPQEKQEKEIWTQKQFQTFLERIPDKDFMGGKGKKLLSFSGYAYKVFLLLLFASGCRRGEILALNVEDVNFEQNFIRVNKSCSESDGTIGTTKTICSNRIVLMPLEVMLIVKNYISKIYDVQPQTRIFPVKPWLAEARFRRYKQKYAKDLPNITLHGLRHSHASMLRNMGIYDAAISDRLGHKDTTQLVKTYGHMYSFRRREIADMLNEALKSKN